MEQVEIEVFTQSSYPVLRMPGRRFPGVVIQGDTLSILAADAKQLLVDIRIGNRPEGDAEYLADRLAEMLAHYADVLAANDIDLPYVPET